LKGGELFETPSQGTLKEAYHIQSEGKGELKQRESKYLVLEI